MSKKISARFGVVVAIAVAVWVASQAGHHRPAATPAPTAAAAGATGR